MPILNVQIGQAGLSPVTGTGSSGDTLPNFCFITTNDSIATVTTPGYLNSAVQQGYQFSESMLAEVSTKTSPSSASIQTGIFGIQRDGQDWSLIDTTSPGDVVLPTTVSHIATYTNTTGGLSEDPTTAISGGNIQAGLSGTSGAFISYPSTASTGYASFYGSSNASQLINVNITNASHAQTSTYTIPDCGASAANFITSVSDGTQTITAGNFAVSNGSFFVGSSSSHGVVTIYPIGANQGGLVLSGASAGADFFAEIRNGTMGQSTVYTIPDILTATGYFMVATSGLRVKNVVGASVAGGSASTVVTDAFCTTSSNVQVDFTAQTNATSIRTVAPGNGSFTVITGVDPGASTISYTIYK